MLAGVSRATLLLGAAWTLFCTLYAGRHNSSKLLVAMFVVWTLSPFWGFVLAIRSARNRHVGTLRALLANSIVVTLTSVVIYSAMAFSEASHQKTFAFLVVPAASWLTISSFMVASRFAKR